MIGTLVACSLVIVFAFSGLDIFTYFARRE